METAIIVILLILCGWYIWRLVTLRKGIESLTAALRSEELPDAGSMHPATNQDRLTRLSAAVVDFVAESDLQKAIANGQFTLLDYVLNQIEDALFIVDEREEIRYSNEASRKVFTREGDHTGTQLIEVCRDHRINETVALAMETGTKMQDEITLSNSGRTFIVQAEPLDLSLSLGSGAWVLLREVTTELRADQVRKDFVANASHELRTPLSIISGYLEVLEDEVDDPHVISLLQKHTERITRIVEDMLTISKLENAESVFDKLNRESFSWEECIGGIVEQLQPIIDNQKAKVAIDLPDSEEAQHFYGDRFYFDQIIFNLIENALKQNQQAGLRITVRVSPKKNPDKHIVEVIDNGVGIPSADLPEVFKRFYRVDKSHAQTVKGTGLGLSIVKRAVEAHQGRVEVTSQPGVMTCFRISVPIPHSLAQKAEKS